jgi:hypothetical protein
MEIFIGNLPRYASVAHLNRFFAGFGRIAQFHIVEKVLDDGKAKRFGHGVIEPDIAAQRAISTLSGKPLLGCLLTLRRYVQRSERERRRGVQLERRVRSDMRVSGERRVESQFRSAHAISKQVPGS